MRLGMMAMVHVQAHTMGEHTARWRVRRMLACLFAPATIVLFVFARVHAVWMHGYWQEGGDADVAFLACASYLGSAVAAPLALLAIRLRGGGISTLRVWRWFAAVCAAFGAIGLTAVAGNPLATLAGGAIGAVGASVVALAYGMIAGLPWRTRAAGERSQAAADPTA